MMRVEDQRLVTGTGSFTDDAEADGALWGAFARSPHAHARLGRIDHAAAMAVPGARLVLTGEDWAKAGLGDIATGNRLVDSEGRPPRQAPWPVLARDKVRHVGQTVALCVAESKEGAEEMAARLDIAFGPLAAVAQIEDAVRAGAPQIWETAPGNVAFQWSLGDAQAVRAAFG
ncbi:MAG: xanthine dehydrogenase family protein molybdopterin-binding subunit, partial [Proteobacteria bacterium]|nr:xanthine dehydrogenase family protein molybdopterin-binding subunit [Pseudomonadota bacterium]